MEAKKESRKESKYKNLLSKFKEKSFDTLKVYSPEELTGEYKGIELDSTDAVLFPEDIAQQHFNDPPGLFAIYKFPVDDTRIGLIARTPSEYVPSSIKLFFFDKIQDTITSFIELAESWGDAGDEYIKKAWLFEDKRNNLKSFIWAEVIHDNSINNEKDTTYQSKNYYYLVDLSKQKADSVSTDEKELLKKFGNLLSQQASR